MYCFALLSCFYVLHILSARCISAAAAAFAVAQVSLQGHERAVSCLDIEHSGNRLVSGSLDYTLRIFDFNGMKADLRSFRWATAELSFSGFCP
jgi:WD40 repeat protein